jgi:hypothetical protein
MLIRRGLCRAHYDLTLASCDPFLKCMWTYAAPGITHMELGTNCRTHSPSLGPNSGTRSLMETTFRFARSRNAQKEQQQQTKHSLICSLLLNQFIQSYLKVNYSLLALTPYLCSSCSRALTLPSYQTWPAFDLFGPSSPQMGSRPLDSVKEDSDMYMLFSSACDDKKRKIKPCLVI